MKKFKGKRDNKITKKPIKVVAKNAPKSRKEIRKEKRNLKKIHKKEYFSKGLKPNNETGRFVRAPVAEDEEEPEINEKNTKKQKTQKKNIQFDNLVISEMKGAKKREDKLKEETKEKYIQQLMKVNEDEDKVIKKLEKQLKLNKRKPGTISKSFVEDGLDYLLEVCDENRMAAAISAEKHLADEELGSDFEEDIAIATGKSDVIKSKKSSEKKTDSGKIFSSDDSVDESDFDENFDDESDLGDDHEDEDEESDVSFAETSEKSSSSKNKAKNEPELESEDDPSEDEDLEMDEEMEEEDDEEPLSDEEDEDIGSMYSGMGEFPDESFMPGKYKAIIEETESDIELYANPMNLESDRTDQNINLSTNACDESMCSMSSESENESDDDLEDEESMEVSNIEPSEEDEAECSDPECYGHDCGEEENETKAKTITVNGKLVNTYGRHFEKEEEPELVRCPKLDQILDGISDNELETKKISPAKGIKVKPTEKRKIKDSPMPTKKLKSEPLKNESNSESNASEELSDDNDEDKEVAEDGTWEDIYGRKRDKDGNIVTATENKYVPPHLRNKSSEEDDKKLAHLKRQIKGLLNKVAGSNMHWTCSQLENIYSSNSRHSVNTAFCSLWMSAVVQDTVTGERLASEHAMLVAILHANVGSEVGAHFLQTLVKKFDELMQEDQMLEDKSLDNLILGLSELYSFKIFHSSLLYEILEKLVEQLSEKSIDCLLVSLRSIGAVLRKDDPAALKVFIQAIQSRATKIQDNAEIGARAKFLLDVLLAIKNNNMNKIPNYDPSYAEELKKALKGIIRKGNYIVPLNIKLDDLLEADERGRWWIVGSAWEGSSKDNETTKPESSVKVASSQKLSELARKLRINTELRRNIFFIIMSAEDYMDAFEKLQQLGLKNQQEREIIHILMVCCLQEKTYNPYYSVLAQKFCDCDRKFQMTIQYSVWDKLKELDNFPSFQISNLAQFLTYLFIEKGLPISILKVVQFSDLTKAALRLMRQVLLALLLQKKYETCLEVFQRAALSPKLHLFRESLRLFISHFLLKNLDKKENILTEEQMDLLKERSMAVDKILSESKSRL